MHLTGPLIDPRPAYDAADIVVGMGSSAGRAMAFAKPTLVIGERGFSRMVTPDTADALLRDDFYGVAEGDPASLVLEEELRTLVSDPALRRSLGPFSRRYAAANMSVEKLARELADWYVLTAGRSVARRPRWIAGALLSGARVASQHVLKRALPPPIRRTLRGYLRPDLPLSPVAGRVA